MHQLGLAGMARAFEELAANPQGSELAPAEWLGLLLNREIAGQHAISPQTSATPADINRNGRPT